MSPSIEYAGHPHYAEPWKRSETGKYYQMVLQCRVNPELVKIDLIKPETLLAKTTKHIQIDPNFSNNELEWVLLADEKIYRCDLICYDLMVRVTYCDSTNLPTFKWWKHVWWKEA